MDFIDIEMSEIDWNAFKASLILYYLILLFFDT